MADTLVFRFRESVDDIYTDVYSEHFYMERALLPIFRVYKLKGISKKLAVMMSAAKDANGARWNRLFDLCHEVRPKHSKVYRSNPIAEPSLGGGGGQAGLPNFAIFAHIWGLAYKKKIVKLVLKTF